MSKELGVASKDYFLPPLPSLPPLPLLKSHHFLFPRT